MESARSIKPIRLYEVDLLRFLAALSVVLFHYTYFGHAAPGNYSPLTFKTLGFYTKYGYLGVDLFFIISGYIILLSAEGKTVKQFFISRVMRLYPAFWIACTLTFLVKRQWGANLGNTFMPAALRASFGQYAYNMTMLEEFFGIPPLDGAYWSLTVELAFYFLISLLISYHLMSRVEWFLACLLLYAVLPALPRTGTPFTALFFPNNAPFFAAGMLFFLVQQPTSKLLIRHVLLVISYLAALQSGLREATENSRYFHDEFSAPVVFTIITLFFVLFYVITFRQLNLSRFKGLLSLGALTYPLYLIHSDIGYIIFHRLGHLSNKYVVVGSTLLCMLGVAFLIHELVEKRCSKALGNQLNKWLHKFDQRPSEGHR